MVQLPVPAPTTTLELPDPDVDVVTLLLVRPSPAWTVTEFGPLLVALVRPLPAVTELETAPDGGLSPGRSCTTLQFLSDVTTDVLPSLLDAAAPAETLWAFAPAEMSVEASSPRIRRCM
jgi:hypothetical protein